VSCILMPPKECTLHRVSSLLSPAACHPAYPVYMRVVNVIDSTSMAAGDCHQCIEDKYDMLVKVTNACFCSVPLDSSHILIKCMLVCTNKGRNCFHLIKMRVPEPIYFCPTNIYQLPLSHILNCLSSN